MWAFSSEFIPLRVRKLIEFCICVLALGVFEGVKGEIQRST